MLQDNRMLKGALACIYSLWEMIDRSAHHILIRSPPDPASLMREDEGDGLLWFHFCYRNRAIFANDSESHPYHHYQQPFMGVWNWTAWEGPESQSPEIHLRSFQAGWHGHRHPSTSWAWRGGLRAVWIRTINRGGGRANRSLVPHGKFQVYPERTRSGDITSGIFSKQWCIWKYYRSTITMTGSALSQ